MIWDIAFETDRTILLRARLTGSAGEWHHHGERDAYGYVLEGRLDLEYGPRPTDSVSADAGDWVYVPAETIYRPADLAGTEPVVLLALVGDGPPMYRAEMPLPTDRQPTVVDQDDLVPADSLENLVRQTPTPEAAVQQIYGHATERMESSWHHHGDNDVFGYVIAGEGYVDLGEERKLVTAGSFFHIPPKVVHRDVNPSDDEQEYVLWLTGSEPRTVHVDGPEYE